MKRKELTARQKTALANHKKKGTHTAQHMAVMKKEMLNGKTFMEAHRRSHVLESRLSITTCPFSLIFTLSCLVGRPNALRNSKISP